MKDFLRNHFIPHGGNDYHPHLLQKMAMGMMLFLVLLSFITANIQALIWVNIDWMVSAVLPAVVVSKTNAERQSDALGALERNVTLDRAAQMKAEHMAQNGYFSHYSPDGVSPWYWFAQAGYGFIHAGENLAVHFNDSGQVVKAWMDSPTHRANIMNGTYTEIGIGIAKGTFEGHDTIFVVQLFGTPTLTLRSDPIVSNIIKNSEEAVVEQPRIVELPEVAGIEESVSVVAETKPASLESVVVSEALVPADEVAVDFTQVLAQAQETVVENLPQSPTTTQDMLTVEQADSVPDSLVLDTLTTSSVPVGSIEGNDTAEPQSWYGSITQPLLLLQVVYVVLGAVVMMTLLISLFLEWRRHNPLQTVYSGGLVATMAILWWVQTLLIGGAVIV